MSETAIKIRRDTSANWASFNPALRQGELGLDLVVKRIKVGDGFTSWSDLPWMEKPALDELRAEYGDEIDFITNVELYKT